jgi:lysophospholipase L1-like esterase
MTMMTRFLTTILLLCLTAEPNVAAATTTLFLAGDSTMAEKRLEKRPETGWGEMLQTWFDADDVTVVNLAKNGRSTRTFIEEGRWLELLGRVRPGDYVLIQFGHNDQSQSKPQRYTPPDAFSANLERFVTDVRSKAAIPVLLTPVVRRRFDDQGQFYDSHGVYPDLVRETAGRTDTALIDLHASSTLFLEEYGAERSKELFLWLEAGDSANYPLGLQDNTHFSPDGARAMAALVIQGILDQLPALAPKVRKAPGGIQFEAHVAAPIGGPHRGGGEAAESRTTVHAFPGAVGFGQYSRGGRGGKVIKVTNLHDDGPGSLRQALETRGPRTVVFDVSGTIALDSELEIKRGFLTVAGQTAPGDGITLRNYGLVISASEVIIRFIRSRPGNESGSETDAIWIKRGENIVLDHCSASWATDETLSVSPSNKSSMRDIDNVTVQWCLITESLNESVHSKGEHGYGSLVRGSGGARYSFHYNLWAHHKARMPRPGNYVDAANDPEGPLFDFRNNVFYNWGGKSSGYNADTHSISHYNFVNNYFLSGPDSKGDFAFEEFCSLAQSHFSGNFMNRAAPPDPWTLVRFKDKRSKSSDTTFPVGRVETESASRAYQRVLRHAGASRVRDPVDTRVVESVSNSTGRLINSQEEVGSWPVLKSEPPRIDSDHDGIPDEWESERGLDPGDGDDGNEDRSGDGYTNLEEYLNSLVPVQPSVSIP